MKLLKRSGLAAALLLTLPTICSALDQSEFDKMMNSYLENGENLEKLGTALENYFRQKREEQQRQAAMEEEKQMEEQFKNPVKLNVEGSPVRGNPDAPITIVEFSDFQCPFCQRGTETMDQLLKEYPDKVKIAFKHLPLPFHP
ncbi:MAG: thioredoxin domain-containing protein, partial [Bdellovibrionales bacterium]|nr:thioredoxin domain-containing protein [Bdellovibrionales bacterium]